MIPPDQEPRKRRKRSIRLSPAPPAILFGPDEVFTGTSIVQEFQEQAGTVLWQAVRDVVLWSSSPRDRRASLFARSALSRTLKRVKRATAAAPELRAMLVELNTAVLGGAGTPETVAAASLCVSQWAEDHERLATALAYAQAAALANPTDAGAAVSVGRLAAIRGENPRAETWYRRAAVLARRTNAHEAQVLAQCGIAQLLAIRSETVAARRHFLFSYRRAQRHGFRELIGPPLQELLELALRAPLPTDDPEDWARTALRAYGPSHPAVPRVTALWARFRLTRTPPVPVLDTEDPIPLRGTRPERAQLLAILAREAAAAGVLSEYEAAWRESQSLLDATADTPPHEREVTALMQLAEAARAAGHWDRAVEVAEEALRRAREADLDATAAAAEALADTLRRRSDPGAPDTG